MLHAQSQDEGNSVTSPFRSVRETRHTSVLRITSEFEDMKCQYGGFVIRACLDVFAVTSKLPSETNAIKLFGWTNAEISYKQIHHCPDGNISIVQIDKMQLYPTLGAGFRLRPDTTIPTKVVALEYAKAVGKNHSHLLCHRGEIQSEIDIRKTGKFYVMFSPYYTGSSGSPVVDEQGHAVGMMTGKLYKADPSVDLPYFTVVPAEKIIGFINEVVESCRRK